MTTKAQLYLNEQTTKRSFEEELAAKDREIAALRTLYEEQLDHCAGVIAKQDGLVEAMRAKCEDIARTEAEKEIEYDHAERVADAIAALKAK